MRNSELSIILLIVVGNTLGYPPVNWVDPSDQPSSNSEEINTSAGGFRLPKGIVPSNYDLFITPFLEDVADFTRRDAPGVVKIKVTVTEEGIQEIKLHASKRTLTVPNSAPRNVKVIGPNDETITVTGIEHLDGDVLVIELGSQLIKSATYLVEIPFNGRMNDGTTGISENLSGLYISSYDQDGTTKYLATTQFEATSARKAFPCFDEPALRATFDIKIGRSKSYKALSNSDYLKQDEPHPDNTLTDYVVDVFKTTTGMPTYLVALHVSQYEFIASALEPSTVKVWGPPGYITEENARFSADSSAIIREFFQDYFNGVNIRDRFPKLDSAAVPQFDAGAMENWGLNNYRMQFLLFNKGDMSQHDLFSQALVIAHEVAHIWYGNLVTINWWNHLWVKEGLATYLQYLNLAETVPSMKAMERFTIDNIQVSMENELGLNTHAIWRNIIDKVPETNPRIIYQKGASIMRMAEGFLTMPLLRKGLVAFLEKYKDSSATQENFLNAIDSVVPTGTLLPGQSVTSVLETWTNQPGYPLIRVSRGDDKLVYVSQEKYFGVESQGGLELEGSGKWDIPVSFTTKADPNPDDYRPKAWIRPNIITTAVDVGDANSWINFNPNAMSFYRVLYDAKLFRNLKNQLDEDHSVLTLSSRTQLLDDYFTLAEHSYVTVDKALDLTTFLDNEKSLAVWTTVLKHLRKIRNKSTYATHFNELNTYISSKISTAISEIEANPPQNGNDQPVEWMVRALLLEWACALGRPECDSTVGKLLTVWMENSNQNPIQADIQSTVYCNAFAQGNGKIQEFIRQKYDEKTQTTKQKELLISARACEKNEDKLKSILKEVIESASYPASHKRMLIVKTAENSAGHKFLINFLIENFANLPERDQTLISVFNTLGNYFSSKDQEKQVANFPDEIPEDLSKSVKDTIDAAVVKISKNRKWIVENSQIVLDWIAQN